MDQCRIRFQHYEEAKWQRVSDSIPTAFHQSCDQADFEVAERLLGVLEITLNRCPPVPDQRPRPTRNAHPGGSA